jgi:mitofilin
LYLTVFSGLTYGAAVFYALRNDNFHDFFTEYIPFGEESVLYFEERSFRKRFPHARHTHTREASPSRPDAKKVTIPQKAGLSWRVKDEGDQTGSDLTQKGRHMSALDKNTSVQTSSAEAQQQPKDATNKEKSAAVESAKKNSSLQAATASSEKKEAAKSGPPPASKPETKPEAKPEQKRDSKPNTKPEMMAQPSPATPTPKSDPRPPAIAPVTQISPLQVPDADEPLVHELVKIVNDIITVVNADSADASNKYSAPINKAKDSLAIVGKKIIAMKEAERKVAEEKINQAHKEFDEGAKELLRRIDAARQEDDAKFREEFEVEREKISHNYEEKLSTELERSQQLAEQRLKNELAEQAIELKRRFISDIKTLVEEERNGRLSKLSDLSTNVDDLQKLTSNWNGIIDSNLATQKLQVAVDAVRASLASGVAGDDRPKPFVREMAALKLVANGDPVVDAAIASVNPTAYQRGIPSPAQLIDRFRRVAAEARKASLLPEDAGIASHAASLLLSKAMFKKQGQPQGSDVESVLTRTETMLEEGDLDGAAREMNTLQGWAGVLSKDWLQDCRKVLEVRQALDVSDSRNPDWAVANHFLRLSRLRRGFNVFVWSRRNKSSKMYLYILSSGLGQDRFGPKLNFLGHSNTGVSTAVRSCSSVRRPSHYVDSAAICCI